MTTTSSKARWLVLFLAVWPTTGFIVAPLTYHRWSHQTSIRSRSSSLAQGYSRALLPVPFPRSSHDGRCSIEQRASKGSGGETGTADATAAANTSGQAGYQGEAVNSVTEQWPLYLSVFLLQSLPALPIFAHGNRVVCLLYFWGTALLAISSGSQRPRADGNPGLSARSAALAPVVSSFFLFGLYLILQNTELDPGLLYRGVVSCFGVFTLQEILAEAMGTVLPPAAKTALDGTPIAALFEQASSSSSSPADASARSEILTNVLGPVEELSALALAVGTVSAYLWLPASQSFALSNVIGLSIALATLPLLDLSSVAIGAAFLLGLLCYDIFWVFGTDVMMTVATAIEAPVKFEFPSVDPGVTGHPFSILGLGDVVIPGTFVALMRDVDGDIVEQRASEPTTTTTTTTTTAATENGGRGHADVTEAANGPYFQSALTGYGVGLALTFAVNEVTKSGQPALFYLVPAVLGSVAVTALRRGELGPLLAYKATRPEADAD